MDVNGYIVHIKQAKKLSQPDIHTVDIHCVTLESLQIAFKDYDSWSDLNDPDSDLVNFLKLTCKHTFEDHLSYNEM